jgi:hypothetical protein
MLTTLILVIASEGNLESDVPVEVAIQDTNDNRPIFTQPLYTATTREDIMLGKTILIGMHLAVYIYFNGCKFVHGAYGKLIGGSKFAYFCEH